MPALVASMTQRVWLSRAAAQPQPMWPAKSGRGGGGEVRGGMQRVVEHSDSQLRQHVQGHTHAAQASREARVASESEERVGEEDDDEVAPCTPARLTPGQR